MPRLPKLCIHKGDGVNQYYVRLNGVFHYLGPVGGPEEESKAEAQRAELLRVWLATGGTVQPGGSSESPPVTVSVLVAGYRVHVREVHSPEESRSFDEAFRPWVQYQGQVPIAEYRSSHLVDLRGHMARGGWRCKRGTSSGWCRGEINKAVGRIRRALRWGVQQGLVPASVWAEVQALGNLRRGQRETTATDHPDVPPASEEAIAAVLGSPVIQQTLRDMVRVQLLTGMRPGELVGLRWDRIDRTGEIVGRMLGSALPLAGCWIYLPGLSQEGGRISQKHKTAHHGHRRLILIGPQAQQILSNYLEIPTSCPIFSPRQSRAEVFALRRKVRRSPVPPSQQSRARENARPPGKGWTSGGYAHALQDAIARENARRLAAGETEIVPFAPNQLRHNAATRLVDQFGWDVARIVLGHTSVSTTRIYAVDNFTRAALAVGQSG